MIALVWCGCCEPRTHSLQKPILLEDQGSESVLLQPPACQIVASDEIRRGGEQQDAGQGQTLIDLCDRLPERQTFASEYNQSATLGPSSTYEQVVSGTQAAQQVGHVLQTWFSTQRAGMHGHKYGEAQAMLPSQVSNVRHTDAHTETLNILDERDHTTAKPTELDWVSPISTSFPHVVPNGRASRDIDMLRTQDNGDEFTGKFHAVLKDNEEDVCSTCLDEYDEEDPKINTDCGHHYHLGCILEWAERSSTCPICSKVLVFHVL